MNSGLKRKGEQRRLCSVSGVTVYYTFMVTKYLVLDVMERSFKLNDVGYVRFDQKQKDKDSVNLFKTSSEIQVFMLHSQSQSWRHPL